MLMLSLVPDDPARAASELASARSLLGSRLIAYAIGNEPDGYVQNGYRPQGYTYSSYADEVGSYVKAIKQAVTTPPPLWGPDLIFFSWLGPFGTSLISNPDGLAAVTGHFYPTDACGGNDPTDDTLMNANVRAYEDSFLWRWEHATAAHDLPHVLSETNSVGCGGNATSEHDVSGVWLYDWVMRAASSGVESLLFHGRPTACNVSHYSPFCITTGSVASRPEGAAILALLGLEGQAFLSIAGTPPPGIAVYALDDGSGDVTLSVVNLNDQPLSALAVHTPMGVTGSIEDGSVNVTDQALDNQQIVWAAHSGAVTSPSPTGFTVVDLPARSIQLFRWKTGR